MRWLWTLILAVAVPVLTAAAATELSPSDCLGRLDTVVADVAHYQDGITNDAHRVACVNEALAKLVIVRQLAVESADMVQRLEQNNAGDEVVAEKEKLLALVARAEQLAAAASNCVAATTSTRRVKLPSRRSPALPGTVTATNPVAAPKDLPVIPRPAWPVHVETQCARQTVAVQALARVLGLNADGDPIKTVAALSARQIEPLGGWQPAECLTLDEFCVAVARAQQLPTADPDEPTSYAQALRDAGWPVDEYLPPRQAGVPVYLVEKEVRAFLAAGPVAPLARDYQPAPR